ncbi:hypothetical protein [Dyadobacter luticola]|uniref:ZU5 domain-containing protein n=1 Tax=Dyadobacter luticola TaxID=1979387 RepID=A0A5R9KZG5_9BACT|nr:hypothetical protein [Dyadobacter luticola]TLV01489.1 hypothetical protein FEN17_18860 [Dyadobacter luticola]
MKNNLLAKLFALSLAALCACEKPEKNVDPVEETQPGTGTGTPTPVGQPVGDPFSKTIGPAGGSISSPDGRLKFTFPAGAIAKETTIKVQPVENHAPGGVGLGYAVTPTNIPLEKDAVVAWKYEDADMDGSAPEALGMAYQDEKGVWQGRADVKIDKEKHTVEVPVSKLAPWAFYEQFYLEIDKDVLAPGEHASIKAIYQTGRKENLPGDLAYPLLKSEVIQASRVIRWTLNGQTDGTGGNNYSNVGQIIEDNAYAKATYDAPPKEPDNNPIAIGIEIDAKQFGHVILTKNMTIISPAKMEIGGRSDSNPTVGLTIQGSSLQGIITDSQGKTMSIFFTIDSFKGKGHYKVNQPGTVMITPLIFGRVPYLYGHYNDNGEWISGGGEINITEYNGNTKAISGTISGTFWWEQAGGKLEPQKASARFRAVPVVI